VISHVNCNVIRFHDFILSLVMFSVVFFLKVPI